MNGSGDPTGDEAGGGDATGNEAGGGIARWFLLDGDRLAVAALLTGLVFVGCLLLGVGGAIRTDGFGPLRAFVGSILGGTLPFITVVLAINQLILSSEFGTTGTFRARLEETREFRTAVETDAAVDLSPAEPAAFLRTLVLAVRERALSLREALETDLDRDAGAADGDDDLATAVDRYVDEIVAEMDAGAAELETAAFGTFEVTSVILDLEDPLHLQRVRYLRSRFDVGEDLAAAIDDLEALLDDVHVARQYFKTVHVQQELANLSKWLLYVGFLTLSVGATVLLADDALDALVSSDPAAALVIASVVALLVAPFTVLFVYVLRVATVARRTAADFGPFLLQQRVPDEERP